MARSKPVSRFLDRLGNTLNSIGLPYATGLTRNKATFLASVNTREVKEAKDTLIASRKTRAILATLERWDRVEDPGMVDRLTELQETHRRLRNAVDLLLSAGLSPSKAMEILDKTPKYTLGAAGFLRTTLTAAIKTRFPADQTARIIEVGLENAVWAISSRLDQVIYSADEAGLSPEQTTSIVTNIFERKLPWPQTFSQLTNIFKAASRSGYSPKQIIKILNSCKDFSHYLILPESLRAFASYSPARATELISTILERGDDNAFSILSSCQSTFRSSGVIGLPYLPAGFLIQITNICGKHSDAAIDALPTMFVVGIKAKDIPGILETILEKHGENTGKAIRAFEASLQLEIMKDTTVRAADRLLQQGTDVAKALALDAAISKGIPPKTARELFRRMAEKTDNPFALYTSLRLFFLHRAESSRSRPSSPETMGFLQTLADNFGNDTDVAIDALPVAQELDLPPTRILDLFRRVLETGGADALGIFSGMFSRLSFPGTSAREAALARFINMCESLTENEWKELTLALMSKGLNNYRFNHWLDDKVGPENILGHLTLLMETITRAKGFMKAFFAKKLLQKMKEDGFPVKLTETNTEEIRRIIHLQAT